MAVLGALPAIDIVDGMKGVIDYYVHQGVPCARSWPRHFPRVRSPAEIKTVSDFALASPLFKLLSTDVYHDYQAMASGTVTTARDLFMRGFLTGFFQPPPHT